MLLNRATADGIADGSITLVLRRWDTARAKPGGTQRTRGRAFYSEGTLSWGGW